MYYAVIVDDEEVIRKGLLQYIDWQSFGIRVIGDFPDGISAYEFIKANKIDILITDVKMPRMDGISLAKRLQEDQRGIKVIFISGHSDIEYIKSALKVDAVDYILKAIDIREIEDTIAHVVEKLNEEENRNDLVAELKRKLEERRPLIQQQSLMLLIRENMSDAELKTLQNYIPIEDGRYYCLLDLQIDNIWSEMTHLTDNERLLRSLEIQESAIKILSKYEDSICFENKFGEYVILMPADAENYEEKVFDAASELNSLMKDKFSLVSRIGISERFNKLSDIHHAYRRTLEAISKRYSVKDDGSILIDRNEQDTIKFLREDVEQKLHSTVFTGDFEKVKQVLSESFTIVDKMRTERDRENFMIYLLLLVTAMMKDEKLSEDDKGCRHRQMLEEFLSCNGTDEQKFYLLNLYKNVVEEYIQKESSSTMLIVSKIREIIHAEFNEQISVNYLSEKVHISATYMCVIFKQLMGKTINEYITDVRIDEAKRLLKDTDIKVYDICFKVGYFSPSYFSKVFKKYCGITPKDYREVNVHE